MDEFEQQLSDVVLFELPSFEDTQAFRIRFRPRWPGWSVADNEVWLFAVDLMEASDELPGLLREAREVLADRGLPAIRFVLDGRVYELDPAEPVYERTAKQSTKVA
jgi:hypothetical protein